MTVWTCLVSDRQKQGSLKPCDFHNPWGFFFCSFRSMCLCSTCTLDRQGEDKEEICMYHMTRSYSFYITCRTVVVIQVLSCSVALWHSESLGLLNYERPFFPISCLLSPSCNLHLVYPFQRLTSISV